MNWLHPPKGHTKGGTTLGIYGSGFANSPRLRVRFASGSEITEVQATWVSKSMITVVTPERAAAGIAGITVSNDGETYSAMPNVYIKGSGTYEAYEFDDSKPGYYGGADNANNYREIWVASNTSGPYIGGTRVRLDAVGLDLGGNTLGASDVYRGPTDASTHFPTSRKVYGTFYPGSKLTVSVKCDIDLNGDGSIASSGESFTKMVTPTWLSYIALEFETPNMDVPVGVDGSTPHVPDTTCKIYVSNDGTNYDSTYASFTYSDPLPTVSSIYTTQSSVWGARGPLDGNTEVIVKGTNFLPSKYLKCKFGGISENGKSLWDSDDVSHVVGVPGGRVRWVSTTEIRCITPEFGPASRLDQYPGGSIPLSGDPAAIGGYTKQGKGETELDPEQAHGSLVNGMFNITGAPYEVVAVEGVPGANPEGTRHVPDSPEDRGSLLPALGQAGLDGSIKPAHQDFVQVSNNYNKCGPVSCNEVSGTPTHVGYRDNKASASVRGYWMWSRDTGDPADCQVSVNQPRNVDGTLAGHNLDKGSGWFMNGGLNYYVGTQSNPDLGHPSKSCLYFLFGDIYVSPSGSDETGHGTASRPYATIQKCINSALTGARDYHVNADGENAPSIPARIAASVKKYSASRVARDFGNRGYGYTVNRDRCILKDGTYWGPGNRDLRSHGRVIQLWAENDGKAVIDCEGQSIGKSVHGAKMDGSRTTALGSIATQGVTLARCGFKVPYAADHKTHYPGRHS